jgi:ABC-type branched-subunit amino acid transport system ATPase component
MDKDITGMKPHDVCRAGIARTFQNIRLFSGGTVLQNVMTACWVRQKSPWWTAPLMLPGFLREECEIREKSMELLNAVGLGHLSKEIATGLPYGAQRRLEIARRLPLTQNSCCSTNRSRYESPGKQGTHGFHSRLETGSDSPSSLSSTT